MTPVSASRTRLALYAEAAPGIKTAIKLEIKAASTPARRIRTITRSKMSPYGSAVDVIQLCIIKSIRGVTELARDLDISVDLQLGDLIARQGGQHRRHPVTRAAAARVQVRRGPDPHAVLLAP